jgi:VRR-NUC domain
MTDAKRAAPREGSPLQNFRPKDSDSTPKIAKQAHRGGRDGKVRRRDPEAKLHRGVTEHLRVRAKPDVLWLHPANGGKRDIREAAQFKRMGMLAGASDLLLWHQGNSFALELKSPGGRLSEAQLDFLARFNDAGSHSAWADDIDRALACLDAWGLLR